MKKIIWSVLLVSSFFFLWCNKPVSTPESTTTVWENQEQTTHTYTSKKDKFSVVFPSSWTFEENVYGASVMFFTPLEKNDTLKENLGIIKKPVSTNYTLDEHYAINKKELEGLVPEFVEISKTNTTLWWYDAIQLIYEWKQSNIQLKRMQTYTIYNDTLYIITYTATKNTFDSFIKEVTTLIESFTLTK